MYKWLPSPNLVSPSQRSHAASTKSSWPDLKREVNLERLLRSMDGSERRAVGTSPSVARERDLGKGQVGWGGMSEPRSCRGCGLYVSGKEYGWEDAPGGGNVGE